MHHGEPLGLGLIGCGDFGRFCLDAFAKLDQVRIAAVADVVPAAAESAGRAFDVPYFTDPLDLIAHPDVHIVHVATPPSTHYGLALAAIGDGKHVLCEKPLALTVEEADEIVQAAAEGRVVAPVDFVLRYNAIVDTVKALLESGVLGRPLAARLTNCAGDTKLAADHWFWDKRVSGGVFVEHGVHFFDLYAGWFGPGCVLSAHAETRDGPGMEDRLTCLVRHDNGVLASHYHGFDQTGLMDRTEHRIVCELGDIRVMGWIPLAVTIDAVVDDAGAARLAEICPGAHTEVLIEYDEQGGRTRGRGVDRQVSRRIHLRYCPESDKQAIYVRSVQSLLADQIAFIHDHDHHRRTTERDGREALVFAEAASRMAAASAPCATPRR